MEQNTAYQGEGKKRRSFLPAPKKPSGVSPTSPQPPPNAALPQVSYCSSASLFSKTSSASTFATSASQFLGEKEQSKGPFSRTQQAEPSNNSKYSEEPAFGAGLRVGAKIKIGGIKSGILRYLGTTHLAPGIFCGIELLDPDGNHDGEVNGHRYFSCAPNHGIFAPKEKVCLDISSQLGRLSSDSEGCYSSTESLSERTQKAFRCFEEGELEAIDCTTVLSPILSPQEGESRYSEEGKSRTSRLQGKSKSHSVTDDVRGSSDSLESQASSDILSRKYKSGLPRAKPGAPGVFAASSKLATFSRTGTKYEEGSQSYHRASSFPGQTNEQSTAEVVGKNFVSDSDQEVERFKSGSARSSEDSEEDGYVRDTLSTGIKKQLRADSRQYLNFTFDQDELNPAQETDDSSESDNNKTSHLLVTCGTAVNPLYSDPRFIKNLSGDLSQENFVAPPSSAANARSIVSEQYMKLEESSPVIFAPVSSHSGIYPTGLKHDGYSMVKADSRQMIITSVSGSETEEDVTNLSVTHSISDSDLPPEFLPRVDHREGDGLAAGCEPRLLEGGYVLKNSGDGSSAGLNLPSTLDSRKSHSYTVSQDHDLMQSQSYTICEGHVGSDINQSQSYTICSHDEPPRDSKRKERDIGVVASQSYTISKSDSATSSPSRKYRKISSSSSANEGGDSSSSGTEPKTDSSSENRGENLDDSSTGASPEVSQALEWDYGQDFDGKIPISQHDSTMTTSASTGTSESLSDVLRDMSEHSDGFEAEMPSSLGEDSDQFETPDNEFENIDSLEDFPIFGKDSTSIMTDSGISDKDFEFCPTKSSSSTICGNSSDECSREDDASSHTTTRAISSDSSQETLAAEYVADTPGSIEDKDFLSDEMCSTNHAGDAEEISRVDSFGDGNSNSPASVVSMEDVSTLQDRTLLCEELEENADNDERHYSSHEDVSSSTDTSVVAKDALRSRWSPMDTSEEQQVDGEEEDARASECRGLNKRERPISLISTTSADTGYAPDTDSELGTMTTNSPNDWVDRLGVTHPTSFAPQVEPGLDGICTNDDGDSEMLGQSCRSESHLPNVSVNKASDDDDYCSDLTGTTEDERIEADQLYGPKNLGGNCPSEDLEVGDCAEVKEGETIPDSPTQNNWADLDNSMDTTCSFEKEEADDNKESKLSSKEESTHSRKSRTRKPVTITKKRSENVDHKLPDTTKVTSRLADYIKAPLPVRPKEEKEPKKKVNKNVKNAIQKCSSVTEASSNINTSPASSLDREVEKRDVSQERNRPEKIEKPKPVIKRAPPKSKWGNIMSQIEASKDTVKPKPKAEIKSSLSDYLKAPLPQLVTTATADNNTEGKHEAPHQTKREFKSKIKPLPPPPPKIDLSKVKSKLNVPTAASAIKALPKKDSSPAAKTHTVTTVSRDNSPCGPSTKVSSSHRQEISEGHIVLTRKTDSISSAKTSHTDLSVCGTESMAEWKGDQEMAPSKRDSVDLANKRDRRLSSNSVRSDHSEKTTPWKNHARPNLTQVKSTIPPFTPIKVSSRAAEIRIGDGSNVSSARSSPTPVILKPIKPKSNSKLTTPAKPAWGSSKPPPSPSAASVKGHSPPSRQLSSYGSVSGTGPRPSSSRSGYTHASYISPGSSSGSYAFLRSSYTGTTSSAASRSVSDVGRSETGRTDKTVVANNVKSGSSDRRRPRRVHDSCSNRHGRDGERPIGDDQDTFLKRTSWRSSGHCATAEDPLSEAPETLIRKSERLRKLQQEVTEPDYTSRTRTSTPVAPRDANGGTSSQSSCTSSQQDEVKYSRHSSSKDPNSPNPSGMNKPLTAVNVNRELTFQAFRQRTLDISDDKSPDLTSSATISGSRSSVSSDNSISQQQREQLEEQLAEKCQTNKSISEGFDKSGKFRSQEQTRKPHVSSIAKTAPTPSSNISNNAGTSATNSSLAQKEIVRLESLCEARTKELTHAKMQLKATTLSFDAMAILLNYCCVELNAFKCPTLMRQLEMVQKQLTDCLSQIADLNKQKESLEQNLSQVTQEKDEASKIAVEAFSLVEKEKEVHARLTEELDSTHNAALTTQRDELTHKHEEACKKLHQYYDKQLDLMKQAFERQMADLRNEGKLEMNGLRISHLEEIQELRNKHDSQMEELHQQHRNKLEDITHRFEAIKLTLSEKVESLRGECEELRHRARNSEEALQRDADVKVQMALAPYLHLPKEIESLRTVVEMRNEEIQKLRSRNMDLEKQMEEIPIAREKIISLQQKVENLEAIINIKTDHEKQLHEKCQVLMRKYDRESRANKRLSMDYEQVMWRMSQSTEFGSTESLTKRHLSKSPPRSEGGSPDPRRRTLSPNDTHGDVVMRVKKRSSHSISEGDRKLRARSATFMVDKNDSSDSHSPSSSPQPKQKRWRKKSQTEDIAGEIDSMERMCRSAGAEFMFDIHMQKQKQKEREELKQSLTASELKQSLTASDMNESTSQMTASDMASSYARSLSGVSDSGVYDSLSRSDVLNSSLVSTDSEFGTSVNLSMTLDSTTCDFESGPQAGNYRTQVQSRESSSETDSGQTSSSNTNGGFVSSTKLPSTSEYDNENCKNSNNYELEFSFPCGSEVINENVFGDTFTLDNIYDITDSNSSSNQPNNNS